MPPPYPPTHVYCVNWLFSLFSWKLWKQTKPRWFSVPAWSAEGCSCRKALLDLRTVCWWKLERQATAAAARLAAPVYSTLLVNYSSERLLTNSPQESVAVLARTGSLPLKIGLCLGFPGFWNTMSWVAERRATNVTWRTVLSARLPTRCELRIGRVSESRRDNGSCAAAWVAERQRGSA